MIRPARKSDTARILELLHQVAEIHHGLRPDVFRAGAAKYDAEALAALLEQPARTPVFVCDEGGLVTGYVFCRIEEVRGDGLMKDVKTLYIDDLCVDEALRGRHIGSALYGFAADYARKAGCYNLTLNVWEGNSAALQFYVHCGMRVRKTCMEQIL